MPEGGGSSNENPYIGTVGPWTGVEPAGSSPDAGFPAGSPRQTPPRPPPAPRAIPLQKPLPPPRRRPCPRPRCPRRRPGHDRDLEGRPAEALGRDAPFLPC